MNNSDSRNKAIYSMNEMLSGLLIKKLNML